MTKRVKLAVRLYLTRYALNLALSNSKHWNHFVITM